MSHGTTRNSATAQSLEKLKDPVTSNLLQSHWTALETSWVSETQFTILSQLWSWLMGTSLSSEASRTAQDSKLGGSADEKEAHHDDKGTKRNKRSLEIPRVKQVSGREEVREPSWKYKCSAPSRGTHRDYDSSADALWVGRGNRAVPDGLRKMAVREGDRERS